MYVCLFASLISGSILNDHFCFAAGNKEGGVTQLIADFGE